MRILLVDEIPKSRDEITAMLKALGHEVVSVETCGDGLQMFAEGPTQFDLIMTESKTCGRVNGVELCQEARRLRQATRTIVTSYLSGESSEHVDLWLEKPFNKRRLEQVLAPLVCELAED